MYINVLNYHHRYAVVRGWMDMSVSTVHSVFVCLCLTLYLCNLCNGQIQYKDALSQGTAIPDLPEVKRVRETQKNISLVEKQNCSDPSIPLQSFPKYHLTFPYLEV